MGRSSRADSWIGRPRQQCYCVIGGAATSNAPAVIASEATQSIGPQSKCVGWVELFAKPITRQLMGIAALHHPTGLLFLDLEFDLFLRQFFRRRLHFVGE